MFSFHFAIMYHFVLVYHIKAYENTWKRLKRVWIFSHCTCCGKKYTSTPEQSRDCWKTPWCASPPRRRPSLIFWSFQTCWAASWRKPSSRPCDGPVNKANRIERGGDVNCNNCTRTIRRKLLASHHSAEITAEIQTWNGKQSVLYTPIRRHAYTSAKHKHRRVPLHTPSPDFIFIPHTKPVRTRSNRQTSYQIPDSTSRRKAVKRRGQEESEELQPISKCMIH